MNKNKEKVNHHVTWEGSMFSFCLEANIKMGYFGSVSTYPSSIGIFILTISIVNLNSNII